MVRNQTGIKTVDNRPDFPALERDILAWWERDGIVEKYLHRNDHAAERYSFLDGPITANNPMGVHHAWGRTYKDLFQRYQTMLGKRQRYQNGFDCQGLWVEVEVEKELGSQDQARHRGVRRRRVRRALQGARAALRRPHHRAVDPPRLLDGLGQTRTSRCPTRTTTRSGTS